MVLANWKSSLIWRIPTLVLAGVVSGTLTYWAVDRDIPVVYTASPSVVQEPVTAGGEVQIEFHVFRKRYCNTHTERLLYDSKNVRYPLPDLEYTWSAQQGFERFITKVPIPDTFAPGPARYRSISAHSCNIIQKLFPIPGDAVDVRFTAHPK